MLRLLRGDLKRKAYMMLGSLFLCFGVTPSSFGGAEAHLAVQAKRSMPGLTSWQKFHSLPGKYSVSFPNQPEHVKQIMPFPEEGYELRYDVYVSAFERKAIYMVLVAEYPPYIDESYAELSLETFLNGLVTQNHSNKLLFADLIEVQGFKALDFFIQTKGVYFKGRAIMAKNTLYLLAMECEVQNYLEEHYNHFIQSFELIK